MKKTYLLWLAFLAMIVVGCRSENNYSDDFNNMQNEKKFQVVPKSEIPQIINLLQSKTNDFKISLNNHSAQGKTQTVFGDINTDFIIEISDYNDTYHVFSVKSEEQTDSKIYNLEVKTNEIQNTESIKIFEYVPTEDWLVQGDNDLSTFSGIVNIYSLDGELENTISYISGTSNCNPPEPCPDCPITGNPGGGGGGTDGGGTPGGGWTGGGSGGGSGGGGCIPGDWIISYYIRDNWGNAIGAVYTNGCETMKLMYRLANRIDCSGSGGVIIEFDITKVISNISTSLAGYNLNLLPDAINFLKTHQSIAGSFSNYIRNNNNLAGAQFVNWGINFFVQNPNTTWEQFQNQFITLPPPNTPIADITDFLSVFNIHQSANLTVYAQQMFGGNGVGHAFISISQGNNVRTYGFYPKLSFPANSNGPGIFGNDSGHPYTHGWNIGTISSTQLQQIIGNSIAFSHSDYNVLMNNCSDFANYALQVAGVNTNASGVDTPNTIINVISSHAQYNNGTAP